MQSLDPKDLAKHYIEATRETVSALSGQPKVLGLIASKDEPSLAYARATQQRFLETGMAYELKRVKRLDLEAAIEAANLDPSIHGIFIYFPIFGNQQDAYLRNLVHFSKDVEAGSQYWTQKLYTNERYARIGDVLKKAVLPCTPLAVIKLLLELDVYAKAGPSNTQPLVGKTVTIFNRSEVIGRPLAIMMSNDGARVISFDEFGPLRFENAEVHEIDISRAKALSASDIVITGVPSANFPQIMPAEITPGTVCVNFSSYNNFNEAITEHTPIFVPRIGPMTVAMCMRNALRLYQNFHQGSHP
jgi:methylenetetrahydrofolate dehydrogenase (NADP+)/methenyltetrahydrofolate cyclohydrolase